VPLAPPPPVCAFVTVLDHIQIPRPEELAVERHLVGAVRGRSVSAQGIEKCVRHQTFSSATFMAAAPAPAMWVSTGARSFGKRSISQTTRLPFPSLST